MRYFLEYASGRAASTASDVGSPAFLSFLCDFLFSVFIIASCENSKPRARACDPRSSRSFRYLAAFVTIIV